MIMKHLLVAITLILAFSSKVSLGENKSLSPLSGGQITPGTGDKVTDWGYVTQLRTGWIEDSMAVFTTAPGMNPGCKVSNAGYATNPGDAGHKLFHAALFGAYFNNKRVQLLLRDCVFDKPRIIAVNVQD
jgi:hypothetical protein